MSLPSSGPISFVDLQAEYGGANPIALNEYYSGGAYVGPNTSGSNGAIPPSGQLSIDKFRGSAGSVLGGARWTFQTLTYPLETGLLGVDNASGLINIGTYLHTSTNGLTWSRVSYTKPATTPNPNTTMPIRNVNGRLIAHLGTNNVSGTDALGLAYTYKNYYPCYSTDGGHTWNLPDSQLVGISNQGIYSGSTGRTFNVSDSCSGMLFNGPLFMLSAYDTYQGYNTVSGTFFQVYSSYAHLSTDGGYTWITRTFSGTENVCATPVYIDGLNANTGTGINGTFIIADTTLKIYTTIDCITFTKQELHDEANNVITTNLKLSKGFDIGGKFFAFAAGGKTLTSTDGVNFNLSTNSVLPNLAASVVPLVAWSGSYLLAVYRNTSSVTVNYTSTDGVTWSVASNFDISTFVGTELLHANGRFILRIGNSSVYSVPD